MKRCNRVISWRRKKVIIVIVIVSVGVGVVSAVGCCGTTGGFKIIEYGVAMGVGLMGVKEVLSFFLWVGGVFIAE